VFICCYLIFSKKICPSLKILKIDDEYEYLYYVPGEIIYPNNWSDELVVEIATLTKKLHNEAPSYKSTKSTIWQSNYLRNLGYAKICSHGDIAPWNVVTKGNSIIGLIDWEFAGPISPEVELARICFSKSLPI
jgi:RIO-like serine/threonine protein kinase